MERLAGRVILLWGWQRRLAALLAGAVASLALAPLDFPAACFIAFPVLVWLLDGAVGADSRLARLMPAFGTGWWFGFGYFLAGMWWLGAGFSDADADRAWLLPFVVLGPPALLALFYGLATLVARLLWSDGVGRIAALAFGFGMAEWLRALLPPGLAWNAVGYTAMPVPLLMQAAQLVGVFGVSALAVFVFSAPALLGTRRHARAGLVFAVLLACALAGYGYARLAAQPEGEGFLQARIVQPGVGHAGFDATFQAYLRLSRSQGEEGGPSPQLILWPELAVPDVLAERAELLAALDGAVDEGQMLLLGTQRAEGSADAGPRRIYAAAVAIDGEGQIIDAADKVRLLPVADYLPYARQPGVAAIQRYLPTAGYTAGTGRRLLSVAEGTEALPLIGNEAAIPGIAARREGSAAIIVNPAAHGGRVGTPAPHQHLRQAQLRAVEAGLPLLLAAPGGISAAIDSRGRIIDGLAPGAQGVLDVRVPLASTGSLNSGHIHLYGLTFVIFFGILALLLSIRGRSN